MEQIDLGLCWLVSFDRVGWKQLHLGLSRRGRILPHDFSTKSMFFCFEEMKMWCFMCKVYIVSACRGLMELGGRLIECLPSSFLKCRNLCFLPMDSWAAFSLGGFVAGWLARDWSLRAPEIPICRCECNVGSSPVVTDQSLVSGNSLLILLGVIGLVIALSNTALAFKVTYRDSETGQGREFAFDVRGKSKGQLGVFGSGKGLQITN